MRPRELMRPEQRAFMTHLAALIEHAVGMGDTDAVYCLKALQQVYGSVDIKRLRSAIQRHCERAAESRKKKQLAQVENAQRGMIGKTPRRSTT